MAATNGEHEDETKVWTRDKEQKLLENVKFQLERAGVDTGKYIYVKDIEWDKVAFGDFDSNDVHKRWNTLTSNIRKLRTAREILEDAKLKVAAKMEKEESRKRKRDDKSSGLPKAPLTSYFIFCEEKRPRLARKHSNLGSKELAKKLAKKWQKISLEKKKKYQDIYAENKKKYDQEMVQYYSKLYPDSKPPRTAFDLWSEKKQEDLKKERPDISQKKMNKKLTKYWEKLEDVDKEEWSKKSKAEMHKYIKKMKKLKACT